MAGNRRSVTFQELVPERSPEPLSGNAGGVALGGGGTLVAVVRASANRGSAVRVWDVATGSTLVAEARSIVLDPVARRALVVAEGELVLRDFDRGIDRALVGGSAFSGFIGDRVWTVENDKLCFRDASTGASGWEMLAPPRASAVPGAHRPWFSATAVVVLEGRALLVWLDARFQLHVIDPIGETSVTLKTGLREIPTGLFVSASGRRAVATGSRGACVLFGLAERKVLAKAKAIGPRNPTPAACLDDGRLVFDAGLLDVVDATTENRATLAEPSSDYERIHAVAPCGERVVTLGSRALGKDHTMTTTCIEVWNASGSLGRHAVPDAARSSIAVRGSRIAVVTETDGTPPAVAWRCFELR